MKYTRLGRTALEVSRLCLGTLNFGPQASEKESHAILDRALEITLAPDVLAKIDTIWPGPGGKLPQAHAW